MRKVLLIGAIIAGFASLGSMPNQARAMTISTPAAVQKAVGPSQATEAAYVCRRVWTHWGWRRSCWWRPRYYGHYYYGWRRPYAYYGWRYHRHWW